MILVLLQLRSPSCRRVVKRYFAIAVVVHWFLDSAISLVFCGSGVNRACGW